MQSSVEKISISISQINRLNPEVITVDNIWLALSSIATFTISKGDVFYLYRCDVLSIHPKDYSGISVLKSIYPLLRKPYNS